MTRIVIITEIGFSKRDFNRIGLNFLKKYFKILILDFTKFSYPNFFKIHKEKTYKINEYREIISLDQAKKIISKFDPGFVFERMNNSINAIKIMEFIKSKNIKIVEFQTGLVPDIERKKIEKFYRVLNLFFKPLSLFKKLKNVIYNKIFQKKYGSYSDILLISGVKGSKFVSKKRIIYAHSLDYELYLKFKKKIKIKNYPNSKIVFLDQYLPDNPGHIIRGEESTVSKKKYFNAMNNFFSYLENLTKKKIVIAAHPRADYKKFNPYKKRIIIQGKTLELVRDADLVLAHTSTSISFAILFNKPIIFLTSNEIIKSYDDYRIHSLSRELDSKLINIDNSENFKQELDLNRISKVNFPYYKKYKDNYIKYPNSPEISLWSILKENLLALK